MASDTTVISKYRAGFVECASEVTRYLSSIDGLDPAVRSRLMSHLSSCTQKVTTMSAMQEAHTSQQQQLMQPMRVQIPQATPMTALPGYATPTSATGGFLLSATTSPAISTSTTSTPPPPPPQSSTRGLHHMSVPGGQFALLVPATDGGYALSSAAHAPLYTTGSDVVNAASRAQAQAHAQAQFLHGQQLRCFGGSMSSSSATSPGMTSPMSVTSDRVFRYGSASDVSSSDEDDVVDVALDMRVEPCRDVTNTRRDMSDVTNNACRDVNANIIKPGGSQVEYQFRRGVTSPTTGSAHTAPRPEVRVVDDMWRPW